MKKLNYALITMFTLTGLAFGGTASADTAKTIEKRRIDHTLGAAREAMKRLDYHAKRYCESRCARYEMDLVIAKRSMLNLENYATLTLRGKSLGKLELHRINHTLTAAKAAIDRLDYYADRQDDRHRLRVTTDVSILDRALINLGNYARLAPRG